MARVLGRPKIVSALIGFIPLTALVFAAPVRANSLSLSPVLGGASTPRFTFLSGSIPASLRLAQRLQPLSTSRQLTVSVTLRTRDTSGLRDFLSAVYDPSSPSYRHFLTVAQFEERFGATAAARTQTSTWLKSEGLRIESISGNGLQITAQGTAGRIQSALDTSLYTYRLGSRTFFANAGAVRLPTAIARNVLAVSGLSTMGQQQPAIQRPMQTQVQDFGYAPSDLKQIYTISPLAAQGLDGTGETIGVVSFGDYTTADIAQFDAQNNLPTPSISRVDISAGGSSGAKLGSSNGQDEAEADIEMLHGIAPEAKILVYEAPNSSQGGINMYQKIVSDNRASIVSTSWGQVESLYSSDEINAVDQALQEGAAQGQTFIGVSGDNGAYDAAGASRHSNQSLSVDFPGSDPWITTVGGTTLYANGVTYSHETAWSDTTVRPAAGSGGGLSSSFSRPSYQAGPGVNNQYSNGMRQVPDVAADADGNTGYAVYTVDPQDNPGWGEVGGTSMAGPLWAAFITLVDQSMGKRIGFLNPELYALGQHASSFAQSPFHDVTSGDNLYYPATTGWDFATGWGSFNGAAFLSDLQTLLSWTGGSFPTAAPTATPRPTAIPTATLVPPRISIQKVLLLHTVKGKQVTTNALKVGERGTLIILYQSSNAGALQAYGSVVLQENGELLKAITLKKSTYGGKPALVATFQFTSKKRVGTLKAHVTLTLGKLSTALDHAFKIVPSA